MGRGNILFLTSVSPKFSANMVLDYVSALEMAGYTVDILTKNKEEGINNKIIYAYDKVQTSRGTRKTIKGLLAQKFPILYNLYKKVVNRNSASFPYLNIKEYDYPTPLDLYIDKLETGKYDAVIVSYMQYMFSEKSLYAIYEKLQVPIYAFTIDMFLMTGGCYYPGKCQGYLSGCKKCPYVPKKWRTDIARHFREKKEIFNDIGLKIIANSWTEFLFRRSLATKDLHFLNASILINENLFCMKDMNKSRLSFNIPISKKFVILAGVATLNKRKGFPFLISALNSFYDLLSEEEKQTVLFMVMGRVDMSVTKKIRMDVLGTGFLDKEMLSKAYSAANIYVSPSIDDAGPSMINQSLMCGTPVISFNIGTALDVIRDGKTGFAVGLKDINEMANSIYKIYKMSADDFLQMQNNCRTQSLLLSSTRAITEFFKNNIGVK